MKFQLLVLFVVVGAALAEDSNSMWAHTEQTSKMRMQSANILMKKNKNNLALKMFQEGVQYNPISSEAWSRLSDIQVKVGQLEEAKESLRRAEALNLVCNPTTEVLQLQDNVRNSLENPSSNIDCEYDTVFSDAVSSMIKELKKGRSFTKDNQEWAKLLRSTVNQLTANGLDLTSPSSSSDQSTSSSSSPPPSSGSNKVKGSKSKKRGSAKSAQYGGY
jgi:tetratricopeptide (TPR) repeat protein